MECPSGECYGPLAVYRICLAVFAFHLCLAGLLYDVSSSKDVRAPIQNGFWLIKLVAWAGLIAVSFFLPNEVVSGWSRYVALWMAGLFILLQIVLLIDFAYSLSNALLAKYEQEEERVWLSILVGGTVFLLSLGVALSGVLYGYFGAHSSCQMNQFFITLNLILGVLACIISCLPAVQEANPSSGLPQAAVMFAYCTYLTASAIVSEPVAHDEPVGDPLGPLNYTPAECNPLSAAFGTKATTTVIGALFTFVALAYSASSAATRGSIMQGDKGYEQLISNSDSEDDDDATDLEAPRLRTHLGRDDEKESTLYSYSFFHVIFALAACYLSMLITNWNTVKLEDQTNWVVGKSLVAVWVKASSCWTAYAFYIWTLVAPILFPDRFS